jgi:hypothetical protein
MGWMNRVRFPAWIMMGFFSPSHRIQTSSGAQPASYPMVIGGSYPGSKVTGSSPSSVEVKNAWSCAFVFMACLLIKHRDNFTFNLALLMHDE